MCVKHTLTPMATPLQHACTQIICVAQITHQPRDELCQCPLAPAHSEGGASRHPPESRWPCRIPDKIMVYKVAHQYTPTFSKRQSDRPTASTVSLPAYRYSYPFFYHLFLSDHDYLLTFSKKGAPLTSQYVTTKGIPKPCFFPHIAMAAL